MGLVRFGRVLSTAILNGVREVKANLGSGEIKNAQMVQPPGEDSNPIASDTAYLAPGVRSGEAVATGYVDTVNAPSAAQGEKRFYSRVASTGAVATEIHMKADGSVVITASADVTINGNLVVTGDIDGTAITASAALTGATVDSATTSLDLHIHTPSTSTDAGSNTSGWPANAPGVV